MHMMGRITRRTALFAAATAAFVAAAPAAARDDGQQIVDRATATFNSMLGDKNSSWLRANIGAAKAVIIAPRIVKAGFILGGSGGNAVLVMRGRDGTWAGPAFYNLSTGSVGFQAGFSEAESITLVMTQRAADNLMTGSFRMGGDLSVATGPVGGGATSNVRADLIAFTRSRGIFGGVNMTGTSVGTDSSRNAAFWNREGVTPTDILVTRTVKPNPGAKALVAAVTTAAK
jgi:lipid-binding SYLF domain-containing protein